jgi:hypothetical protein
VVVIVHVTMSLPFNVMGLRLCALAPNVVAHRMRLTLTIVANVMEEDNFAIRTC